MRSQVHEGCVVPCAMKRRLGPIFNAANDTVEQTLSKTKSRGAGTRRRLNLPETLPPQLILVARAPREFVPLRSRWNIAHPKHQTRYTVAL
jgi:hypothetical protein